jgi:hypothetical protein
MYRKYGNLKENFRILFSDIFVAIVFKKSLNLQHEIPKFAN